MFQELQTNARLAWQKSESRREGRCLRAPAGQHASGLQLGCMHGLFLLVLSPARIDFFQLPCPPASIVHHRDRTRTPATHRHSGGMAQKSKRLRRNNSRVFAAPAALAAQMPSKNAAKHEFMIPLTMKSLVSPKSLYAVKYAQ